VEMQLVDHRHLIEPWFEKQWSLTAAPVYGSVDLRNAGFKLAPVDMNLFPAGFNNLNPNFFQLSVEAAKVALQPFKKIVLVPENHTRNLFYWESIATIKNILKAGGFDVRVGTFFSEVHTMTVSQGESILLEPLLRDNDQVSLAHFVPDVILLNNDLSEGIPDILKNLRQPILPPSELGWNLRLKSGHFRHYEQVSNEFATLIQIDPWFISPLFRHCGDIDFMQNEGEECLIAHAEALFKSIQKKYEEYKVESKPFIIVKADAGTYGMAVMTVRNIDELRTLNRKQRTKMSSIKGGKPVHRVILQEGIYTFETWGPDNAVAEPVVYLWGQRAVGGFYRVHKERGIDENLNSPGMQFEPLAFRETCDEPTRFYAYGVIARLSMLAAAREISEHQS